MIIIESGVGISRYDAGLFVSGFLDTLYTSAADIDRVVYFPSGTNRWVINPGAGITSGIWEQGLIDGFVFVDSTHGVDGFTI